MAVAKTQGTQLYVVAENGTTVQGITCPTGITGLGGAADQIDVTCLSDLVDKAYLRGLGNPGVVTVPFNLDPADASHKLLFTYMASGAVVNWLVALSDGTAAATAVVAGVITPPTGRSCFGFNGYVADVVVDIATNEIVRGTLTIQRTGPVTETWKA